VLGISLLLRILFETFFDSRNIYQIMPGMRAHMDDGVQVKRVILRRLQPVHKLISISLYQTSSQIYMRSDRIKKTGPFYSDFQILCLLTGHGKQPTKINTNVNTSDNADIPSAIVTEFT
jgi:hypothetical protein